MTALIRYLERRSRAWLITTALALVAVIAVVDCFADPHIAVTIFYFVPVCLAAWFVGPRFGVAIALLSDIAAVTDDLIAGRLSDSHWMTHSWNATVRLGVFLVFVWLLRKLLRLCNQMEDVVEQRTAALTIEIGERKRAEKDLLETTERERQHFGRELHDCVCQQLVATALASSSLERGLVSQSLPDAVQADQITQSIRQIATECRQLAQGLYPTTLEIEGLRPGLEELAVRAEVQSGVPCRFLCDQEMPVLDTATALHLYRIAQEALNNAVKHARSASMLIALTKMDGEIILIVKDNGVGMPQPLERHVGMGLRTMARRAELIGAMLDIRLDSDGGTQITCAMPFHESPPSADREEPSGEHQATAA